MSSKQTRKSISITGTAYWALKARCEKDGKSMSGVAEVLIREFLDLPERGVVTKDARLAKHHVESVAPKSVAPKATQAPKPYSPVKDIETVLREVVGPPVVVVSVVPPKPAPKPVPRVIPESVPADRAEQIRAAVDRIEARKEEPVKKNGVPLDDMASKIFTF